MTTGTDRLIEDLSSNLQAVRRIPPLRALISVVSVLWLLLFAVAAYERGLPSHLMDRIASGSAFAPALLGLWLAASGGVVAGLSAGVPGREQLERGGRALTRLGLGAALLGALYGLMGGADQASAPPGSDAACFSMGLCLGLLPGAVLVGFLLLGWVSRPIRAGLLALTGGFALGALAVHLLCPLPGARHLLVGHLGPVLLLPLLGFMPLAGLLRRHAR